MERHLDDVPIPLAGVTLGPEARVRFLNRRYVSTYGFTLDDLRDAEDFIRLAFPEEEIRAEARAWWGGAIAESIATGASIPSREFRIACKDGSPRDVIVSASVVEDVLLISLVDVSGSKRVEERLRVSEARHRLLADNARDVVWTMALDGRVTYVSPSVEAVRGITPEEAMRQGIDEIHPPHSAAVSLGYFTRLHAAIREGSPPPTFRGELEYKRKDGTTFWTEVMAYPIVGDDGKVVEVLGVTRDLSDRKRFEEASRLAAMGTLVAGVAHEVNNPLHGVLASDAFAREELGRLRARIARGEALDPVRVARELETVEEALADSAVAARRIADIVRDLTVLGRPDVARARIDVRDSVRQALSWLPGTGASGVLVDVEDRAAPEVLASGGQLVQVLVNLLANAVFAVREAGRSGRVSVRTRPGSAGMARIEVVDDGCGISAAVMPRIFDPFYTTRPPGQGTGLGLAICRAIVTAHGGTITAESEQGKGSTFRVELPVAPEAA